MMLIECYVQRKRRECRMKQEELAARCNMSVPALSRMERGLTEPGVLVALRVAEVLDCGLRELWPSSRKTKIEQANMLATMPEVVLDPDNDLRSGAMEILNDAARALASDVTPGTKRQRVRKKSAVLIV